MKQEYITSYAERNDPDETLGSGNEDHEPTSKSGPSRDALLENLYRVEEIVDRRPRQVDVNEYGEYSRYYYEAEFGGWPEALRAAGYTPYRRSGWRVPLSDLIDDLLRVAEIVDGPPRQVDMHSHGKHGVETYQKWFGSWAEALSLCGLPARKRGRGAGKVYEATRSGYGKGWKTLRRRILERDRYRCQDCGIKHGDHHEKFGQGLEIHHIIPVKEFEREEEAHFSENLIALCSDCHTKWEPLTQEEFSDGVVP